jgi:hypothetical protein
MIEAAIHLASSDSAGGCLKAAGAKGARVRIAMDYLTVGPCDRDPERHRALRRAWAPVESMGPYGFDDVGVAIAGEEPVVVWATRAFAELVWLWWVLDGIARVGMGENRPFLLARPRPRDPLETTGGTSPKVAKAAFAAATPLTDETLREGAELWSLYAAPSPLAFDEARRRGSPVFPEIAERGDVHGAWFPRLDAGQLRLSLLDELLLGGFGDTWRNAHRILAHELTRPFGVFYIYARLKAWASRGALERKPGRRDEFDDEFRLTEQGRRLLEHGLERVDDAPPLHVGGCRINDPAAPWVRIDDTSGWRLAAGPT